ncbi:MAG: hypothetical protein GWN69_14075, partial [Gammaproteobacteria bacterium]|nr:hypothetical protein [Gammaproteobacteria bacterium]
MQQVGAPEHLRARRDGEGVAGVEAVIGPDAEIADERAVEADCELVHEVDVVAGHVQGEILVGAGEARVELDRVLIRAEVVAVRARIGNVDLQRDLDGAAGVDRDQAEGLLDEAAVGVGDPRG